ncbi:MAG TPA: aminotransferase class III-fold pyridoxal phosphate-dependent enzyme, partial [Thermoanaerobaculia bacterium]|nr:aminotransferase class III-fold pyridoxal phosphate-dependent enzyme [Thermoanaerobaculia bacterium]
LIARFTQRTKSSRAHAQRYRSVLADYRASVGFRLSLKEMLYPIVAAEAKGSRIRDLDGNEYIDLTNGFGVLLFGHEPEFLAASLREHARDAFLLGPRSPLAGEDAQLVSDLTGMERVAFCNSGTEAVMAAIRLARARTGRSKIVVFEGSYHGHADQTLAQRGADGASEPVSPGIPGEAVENTIVLEYGSDASLDALRKLAPSLAAVVVEPVQSSRLELQPADFLRELRILTRNAGVALIFDEMITGFRLAPGGAQEHFGVRADLATYGKIIGGGMPIGVVAGAHEFMDGIDGGVWSYGDASFPAAERTFFGGTFCQHPLAMAASVAVLRELKRQGGALQRALNEKTTALATRLNRWFDDERLPMHLAHCGSAMRLQYTGNLELLFFHLLERGIYIWEWRGCFLSTAHTDDEIQRIETAVHESVDELRNGAFLPRARARAFPTTEAQRQLWRLAKTDEQGNKAYVSAISLELRGPFNKDALQKAADEVAARHDALRVTISEDGATQIVASPSPTANPQPPTPEQPGLRIAIESRSEQSHLLTLAAHHIVTDGWSMTNIAEELFALYDGQTLPAPMQFDDYVRWQERFLASPEAMRQKEYWLAKLEEEAQPLDAFADHARPPVKTYRSRRLSTTIDPERASRIRAFCQERNVTLFMFLYAAYTAVLHRFTGADALRVGVSASGRGLENSDSLVGYCTHVLPVVNRVDGNATFEELLASTRATLVEAYANQDFPYAHLRTRAVAWTFNLDRAVPMPRVGELELRLVPNAPECIDFDLMVNIIDLDGALIVDCDFTLDLYEPATIESLLDCYETLIDAVVADSSIAVGRVALAPPPEPAELVPAPQRTLHAMFESRAEAAPDAIALTYQGE